MLKVKNLTFQYLANETEFCYNFTLEEGEIIAVFGASGAGKSTLLELIAGFLYPKSGKIIFNGKQIENIAPEKRPVSILFQSDNLFDHLSVYNNLALAIENKNNKEIKIKQALQDVGLENFTHKKADELSGGQKQRIALARTLLRNKPILLLDEPFAALDEKTAKNMQKLLIKLIKKHNWHTIMATHNRKDAIAMNAKKYTLKNNILTKI